MLDNGLSWLWGSKIGDSKKKILKQWRSCVIEKERYGNKFSGITAWSKISECGHRNIRIGDRKIMQLFVTKDENATAFISP